jgi:putative transposase
MTMPDQDPYVTIEEAMELTGLARRTLFEHISAGLYGVKRGETISGNGRPETLLRLHSLQEGARLRYMQRAHTPPVPAAPMVNLVEYPTSVRDEAMRRLSFAQQALEIMESRESVTTRMAAMALQAEKSSGTLYNWARAYQARGLDGLLPGWGKLRGRFTALSEALQGIIKDEFLRPSRPSPTEVHRRVAVFCKDARIPAPSVTTINRFLKTIPRPVLIASRFGEQARRAHAEPKIHRDYLDLAVGEMWVGDHRELDLFVLDGGKVFRPWLTAWLDLRSRTLVGWHLDLIPNAYTIALALRQGVLRFGLPRRLYMDNGKDFTANFWGGKTKYSRAVTLNQDSRTVLALLNVTVTHAQVRAPWSKAIEPWFGHTLPPWERTLPGWCGRDNKERPEKLQEEIKAGALLTLDDCRRELAACIEAYHDREHSGDGMDGATPRSCWMGIEKRIPDPRALDLVLMKHKPAMVNQNGLRLFGFKYWHDALIPHFHSTVEVRYDPGNIGALVVFKDNVFLCEALADKPFSMGMTEKERRTIGHRRKVSRQHLRSYAEDRAIAMDPDKAAELVVNMRPPGTVHTMKHTPRPEPGGSVMPTLTGFEQAASAVSSACTPQDSRPGGPVASRRGSGSGRPAPAGGDRAAEWDRIHEELLGL